MTFCFQKQTGIKGRVLTYITIADAMVKYTHAPASVDYWSLRKSQISRIVSLGRGDESFY